jgi:hypothetical protein
MHEKMNKLLYILMDYVRMQDIKNTTKNINLSGF